MLMCKAGGEREEGREREGGGERERERLYFKKNHLSSYLILDAFCIKLSFKEHQRPGQGGLDEGG